MDRLDSNIKCQTDPGHCLGNGCPVRMDQLPEGVTSIALYGSSRPLLEAGAKIMTGGVQSQGRLPVHPVETISVRLARTRKRQPGRIKEVLTE